MQHDHGPFWLRVPPHLLHRLEGRLLLLQLCNAQPRLCQLFLKGGPLGTKGGGLALRRRQLVLQLRSRALQLSAASLQLSAAAAAA